MVGVQRADQLVPLELRGGLGSFSSANTSDVPAAFSSSSRSTSMSAAVVSTSVIGSAAIRIHGRRIGREQGADLVAERPGVGEEQRSVEPEDHQARKLLGVGMELSTS